jgi:hypothetical protein
MSAIVQAAFDGASSPADIPGSPLHDSVRWKYHAVGQYALNDRLCDPFTCAHPYSGVES